MAIDNGGKGFGNGNGWLAVAAYQDHSPAKKDFSILIYRSNGRNDCT